MMKRLLFFIGILLSISAVFADDPSQVVVGPFGPLNNRDTSVTIPSNYAQDLLNVDLTPGGRSFKKRKGYGLFSTLNIATAPVHGIYNFFDNSGNNIALFFNDRNMSSSVNNGSSTVLLSTGTNNATYQCIDSQGFAYCEDSARGSPLKTNGVTFSYLSPTSNGTIVSVTPDRLVLGGFLSRPNDIDFSAAGDFTSWTTGVQPTSAFSFTVASPGSGIKHMTYAFNRIIWFKDQSFGYILQGQTVSDWVVRTISPTVGTFDNSSVYWQGVLYWRGQDGHIYAYDGSNYQKISKEISGTIALCQKRTSNSWSQNTTSDFTSGSISSDINTGSFTNQLAAGNVLFELTTSTDFQTGISDPYHYSDSITNPGTFQMTFPDTFSSFRDGTSSSKNVWTKVTNDPGLSGVSGSLNASGNELYFNHTSGDLLSSVGIKTSSILAPYQQGTTYYISIDSMSTSASGNSIFTLKLSPNSVVTGGNYFQAIFKSTTSGYGYLYSITDDVGDSITATTGNKPFPIIVQLYLSTTTFALTMNSVSIKSGTHTWPNGSIYAYAYQTGVTGSSVATVSNFDIFPTSFTWTTPNFNTTLNFPLYGAVTEVGSTANRITYNSQSGSDGINFNPLVSMSYLGAPTSAPLPYIRFYLVFKDTALVTTPCGIDDFYLWAAATGTYQSVVHNATSLSSWDVFISSYANNSNGTNSFSIRASTNYFTTSSSTPSWTSIINGATPSISTGTYFQIRDVMQAPTNSSLATFFSGFTQNWLEGNAADKCYSSYYNDSILFSVTYGAGATVNNRVLKYDLLNSGWLLYDIGSNGFFLKNLDLYFGDSNAGKIYKYGFGDTDNGSAINAYWKSKDFIGDDPFKNNEYRNLSLYYKVQNSTANVTYVVNGSSSTTYTVYMGGTNSYKSSNRNLPIGTVGNSFSINIGNNATDQPFEVMSERVGINPKPWVPSQ